jgi:hypothetical protein
VKAVTGAGAIAMATEPSLSSTWARMGTQDPTDRMAAYLRAYKSDWFYKAESKISRDIGGLKVQVMPEGADGDNERAIVPPDLDIPVEALNPLDQFLRLMERPNPYYTGRVLRQKTQIRRDMAGAAFWYLEGGDGGMMPSAIYGISPARMWPAYDRSGSLIGWVMDKDAPSGGVPFSTDEIVAFINHGPSDGYDPVGVVEAVWAHVPITERLAVHTADTLATGGRLGGMVTPKERSLDEAEFQDVLRAWRNVVNDPNAARRLLVFPEPMEWTPGAATPQEIGIPELSALTRDEILTAFPISPYMLGVPMAGGLNESGASRREEKATYWEETIHPRVEDFEEDVQVQLLPRYEAVMGQTFDFEVQEPNLDDAQSILEKAAAIKELWALGFDAQAAIKTLKLDNIAWNGMPELLDPAKQAQAAEEARQASADALARVNDQPPPPGPQPPVKAVDKRQDVIGQAGPGFDRAMRTFLRDQKARVSDRIRETYPKSKAGRKAGSDDWWDQEAEDKALKEALRDAYRQTAMGALGTVSDAVDRSITKQQSSRLLEGALQAAGKRITAINETTREAIADTLAEGVRRGYSIPQLIDGVPAEGFAGVQAAPMKNGQPAFDELRAETIARTETMNAYNDAALRGYDSYGVSKVEAIDGDDDEECASRHGQVFTVDEALDITDHPNGTLDWVPVLDKAYHEPVQPVVVNVHEPRPLTKTVVRREGDTWIVEEAWTGS